MTIGIAAAGKGAGLAILEALARLEAVTEGAIGGFVSVAALRSDGSVARAEMQGGGAHAVLARGLPAELQEAPRAVLMSSGPDRPEPLAQFTPARGRVGLVTGHRFPNARGVDRMPLGEQALAAMAAGEAPDVAARRIAARNPGADAGLILLSADGHIGLANTELVLRHPDLGQAVDRTSGRAIAVLHNSIAPHGGLAEFAVGLVARRLGTPASARRSIRLVAGLPVRSSAVTSRVIVEYGQAIAIEIATAYHGDPSWSAGLGPATAVFERSQLLGHMDVDPFLIVRDGRLVSADGHEIATIAYKPIDLVENGILADEAGSARRSK